MTTDAINLVELRSTSIPDEGPVDENVSHCRVCGKGIDYLYGGRGRRPVVCEEHAASKATKIGGGNRGSGNAVQAADALDDVYSLLSFGLMMLAPRAASLLAESREGQRAKNLAYLQKDPDLCKAINKVGKSGGRVAFFASQGLLIAPVALLAVGEMRERATARDTPTDSAEPFSAFVGDDE